MKLNNLTYTATTNNTINSLSPYVGKIRLDLVAHLIDEYAINKGYIFDPFCGSGSVLLCGWQKGFDVIGCDLNPYAYALSMGKLAPYASHEMAEEALEQFNTNAIFSAKKVRVDNIPMWVRSFFNEDTLKEICAWSTMLKDSNDWFLLSCLMGILHHQRPGFLSYPSSHGAPYLRSNKFPRSENPELYEYRNVYDRLKKKVERSYRGLPNLDFSLNRKVYLEDSSSVELQGINVSTIITSPPYMKSLTYARDNRLRLWFLGVENWEELDKSISPTPANFIKLMKSCFSSWSQMQKRGSRCIVIIGDVPIAYNQLKAPLYEAMRDIAKPYYTLCESFEDPIPESKKVVKGNTRIKREVILVLRRR